MKYETIPGLNKKVSKLIFGTSSLGSESGYRYKFSVKERRKIFSLFDYAYMNGYVAFDAASIYMLGESEKILGEWISVNGIRSKIVIITKGAHPSYFFLPSKIYGSARLKADQLKKDIETSLARLKTDYIDIYMPHRDDDKVRVSQIIEALNIYVSANNIKLLGASNWKHERIDEANKFAQAHGLAKFSISSPHYSLFEWSYAPWKETHSIAGKRGEGSIKWYSENAMPIFAWSPLAGGFFNYLSLLSQKKNPYMNRENLKRLHKLKNLSREKELPISTLLLSYLLCQKGISVFPIVKSINYENICNNVQACDVQLSPQELEYLYTASF